ncbi:type I restriction-modification system subunit M N-terminal domain-containing protein [Ruegeria sp. HKCCA5763]|uniref:type I restriction-modification system subunit M n=1 Tax=Ruegeria sp. HKCCA5763 TaxID=2682987 RepID=UPI002739F1F3|nr:type I restriction-modification system subunit M N-terminal domain-containing protein [Ruegeria sp. HKCCA5763]
MLTGPIRSQVDQIWNAFWSGGVSNPLSVIEQITYLLFIKRLDDLHTVEESKAEMLDVEMERRIFPAGNDPKGEPYENLRWSRFKNFDSREMMRIVDEHVFPFLRELGEEGSSYGTHMKDARLGFSNPSLLAKVVQQLDDIPMDDRDTKGDVYEYMLGKIASAGQNGQFRTPRHIIQLMVNLMAPTPKDVICDPAAGTCGFLVEAGEYVVAVWFGGRGFIKKDGPLYARLLVGDPEPACLIRKQAQGFSLAFCEARGISFTGLIWSSIPLNCSTTHIVSLSLPGPISLGAVNG